MTESPFAKEFVLLAAQSQKSYRQIAKEMGISPPLLARVINGTRPPTETFVEKTIQAFDLGGNAATNLRKLADISQDKISYKPLNYDQAERLVAFIDTLKAEGANHAT